MSTFAIITAAGSGTRFGSPTPKQYLPLAGRPLLRWSVEALLGHPRIAGAVVVIDPAHRAHYEAAIAGLDLLPPVAGGPSRQSSVRAGLEALQPLDPERVLVHDGARPCIGRALIDRVLEALNQHAAVVPTLPVTDTLRLCRDGEAVADVDRTDLHRMQTPQGFHYQAILQAHRAGMGRDATDDAALVLLEGGAVTQVSGEEANLKVTTEADRHAAERALRPSPLRWATGMGFDVHRLVPGRRLVLGGVEFEHELGLEGHSDADVVLHALTDAILGGLGQGDIGQHFPPSEERWRDADSAVFIRHAMTLAHAAGATVENVDLTVIGERPRIGPYRQAMRVALADMLGVAEGRVNIKATTTERLGFTGRGEGLAAQAVATLAFWS